MKHNQQQSGGRSPTVSSSSSSRVCRLLLLWATTHNLAQAQRRIACSATEQFTGLPFYRNSPVATAAPLRGSVGCVDLTVLSRRTIPVFRGQDAVNIYGPNEAGFTNTTPGMYYLCVCGCDV